VSASTGSDSVVYKSVTVSCPAGMQVVGGGYSLPGALGSVVLDDFIPTATSVKVGAGEVVGPGEPSDGTTANWSVTATATCANPLPGWQISEHTSVFAPGTSRIVSATCPIGEQAIGAFASLTNGWGQISIDALLLNNPPGQAGWAQANATDDEDGYSG